MDKEVPLANCKTLNAEPQALGVTPKPRLPEESIVNRFVPFVLNPSVFAAGKNIPLPVVTLPVGMSFVAVAVPVVAKFVPSNVSAAPLVATLVPFRYRTPLAVPPERVRLPDAVNAPTPATSPVVSAIVTTEF